ncbi:MAG: phosphate--acyl-ACP acyltransferase, partial [Bacteroidia bacterium]
MRIGLDVMGGDFAPGAVLEGALDTLPHLAQGESLVLIGDESVIHSKLKETGEDPARFEIIHADQVIGMGEHPARAYSNKVKSSIAVGYSLLKRDDIQGFTSAGNTGAMLVGASYTVNVIPGVFRPALVTILPSTEEGKQSVILDVGLNPDSKPDVLLQYARLGSLYARYVLNIENPTVGL